MKVIYTVFLSLIIIGCSESRKLLKESTLKYELIELEGTYQGKNIYIKNVPLDTNYCVTSIFVNKTRFYAAEEIQFSAFEIQLDKLDLKKGDPLYIQLFHQKTCTPEILNPEVLKAR